MKTKRRDCLRLALSVDGPEKTLVQKGELQCSPRHKRGSRRAVLSCTGSNFSGSQLTRMEHVASII